jgi:endonuclease/exonuclease/phosphatase family metal-dependent hydrolase
MQSKTHARLQDQYRTMTENLHIATYNIHKGFSNFNRRMVLHELRERLRTLNADLIFLQEVQGSNETHGFRHTLWSAPQHEFLADEVWKDFAYGKNAVYEEGHHGNAILSRYPISRWENEDISAHPAERRGLLHAELEIPGWKERLHAVCVHLGLFERWRAQQIEQLCERIERMVPHNEPLVIAGDFNDWQMRVSRVLRERLNLREVFESTRGRPARSYPAGLPILRLDRIYVRGFRVTSARPLRGEHWARLSDHAPLAASLART